MRRPGATVRYAPIANKVVRFGYTLTDYTAWTVNELLEACGSELEIDHILCENDTKRVARVTRLAHEIDTALELYVARRLRCPLRQSASVAGSYVPGFATTTTTSDTSAKADADLITLSLFRFTPNLEDIFRTLSPSAFEALCGKMLRVVGCENVTVTQASKDDGVDALAELPMSVALEQNSALHRLAGSLSFLVYTQAKRYALANPVTQQEVLELSGSWSAMRNAYFNRELSAVQMATLERANYRAADPVILLLMTSGLFTSGALAKARALGIILLDGEQMAQLAIEMGWLGDEPSKDALWGIVASHLGS